MATKSVMDLKDYNILYVDDEPLNLSSFALLFRKKFNIITADSPKQGLEILSNREIHLIIADQRMPQMTGVEFLKIVKERWPLINSILLTAYRDNEVAKQAINEAGIYWYLNKPFEAEQLEFTISKAIESYQSAKDLKNSEMKFRGVFDSISDVFVRSDQKGLCTLISPSVEKILGYKPTEIIGTKLSQYYRFPKERQIIIDKLRESNSVENFEFEAIRKDGAIVMLSSNSKLYSDEAGSILGIEGVFRDITEKKKREKEILNYQNRLKGLARELTMTEEKIRKQIATDLHDDVGQLLASCRMQLARVLKAEGHSETAIRLKNISKLILNAIHATRMAIFDLSPPQLNQLGLYATVHDWMNENIQIKFFLNTNEKIDEKTIYLEENTRLLVFRSIKELLVNIVKHAKADQINVLFTKDNDYLIIDIEDDGKGFKYESDMLRSKNSGYGLFSIKERMADIGGELKINSIIGSGTKVTLSIPFNNKE